jgi:hypothetical protein
MDAQVKLSKPMQWFVKIGMAAAAVIGHINVLNTASDGGWPFAGCVCIQLFILLYGLWLTQFLDE